MDYEEELELINQAIKDALSGSEYDFSDGTDGLSMRVKRQNIGELYKRRNFIVSMIKRRDGG